VSEARTLWEEGREPGRQVVALGLALSLTVASLDLILGDGIGILFDASFVVVCVAVALLVRPQDFFTVGVLPPLIMLVIFGLLALTRPAALTDAGTGAGSALLSGLASHCVALGVGYGLCLVVLAVRDQVLRGHAGARPGTR
jgi:hypothetical protein